MPQDYTYSVSVSCERTSATPIVKVEDLRFLEQMGRGFRFIFAISLLSMLMGMSQIPRFCVSFLGLCV